MRDMAVPMDIDEGQLDEIPSRAAFVLGVEWERVRRLLGQPVLVTTVRTDNQRRIDHLLERAGYFRKWYLGDDLCDVLASVDEQGLQEDLADGA